jgi:phage regulator Rha-like protein
MALFDELTERRAEIASRRANALAVAEALTEELDEMDRIIAAAQPAADEIAQEKLAKIEAQAVEIAEAVVAAK